jgi:hypothetical protein
VKATLARKFGKIQRGSNIPNLVNITPTERKLIIDKNIHTLISSFENTTANHLCGGVGGGGESPAKRGRYSDMVDGDDLRLNPGD